MKKFMIAVIIILITVFIGYNYFYLPRNYVNTFKDKDMDIAYIAKLDEKDFYLYKYGNWHKEFIKGVNMGAAKPGYFPGELGITKEDYLRWFRYIGDMNANSIRVYTILNPEFYEALYEYNSKTLNPIYLFQGVWVNEEDLVKKQNLNDKEIKEEFEKDVKSLIDIIHGKGVLPPKAGHASGVYTKDISPYVMGWILGIEWDPYVVENTNKVNEGKTFEGKYLYTAKEASPFESTLCELGDYAIDYETSKYHMQRPLSFTNWVTTDMLKHPNEPLEQEDLVTVNTENIKHKDSFKPGLFASYHIYPYYPDFMNYQKEYAAYKDKDGKVNTYRAYLKDLRKEHNIPVLVAEFGIPAARGMAHENIHMGFNQGNVDERSQGEMDDFMLQNIYEEGYAGGLVFAWQDEWFKRTWNTMDLDIPDRRAYWSNPQTNEQEFGILAFEPGNKINKCYVDGKDDDWKKDTPLAKNDRFSLYAKSDEKYLYFMARIKDFDFNKDKFIIPIDITENSGNTNFKEYNIKFNSPMDFVIIIDGKEKSKVMVDAYYDSFYYTYGKVLKMIETNINYEKKNSGIFNPMYLCLNRELYLPEDKAKLPLSKYETGKLMQGNGNPKEKNYNSLTDYTYADGVLEIRIPWQLINVMDPSEKIVMDDFYAATGIKPMEIKGLKSQGILISEDKVIYSEDFDYSWDRWDMPAYHERLKPSYYILKDAFKKIGGD